MPPISTDKNTSYGPPLVNQKYSPLLNIDFDTDDTALYSSLLTKRRKLLTDSLLLPQPLTLAAPNWRTIIAAEAGQSPPLVVISSNRSGWIAAGIEAANQQLTYLDQPNFANASDLNALTARIGQTVSPPIYCPKRIGAAPLNRNIYIVVHSAEYQSYTTALADTGMTVIGWQFKLPRGAKYQLTGFGASRYAAIEFCKALRAAAANPWDYAWLFDDNVVALTNFAGFAAAEAAMTADDVCVGFHGGTKAETPLTNKDWARNEIEQGRGGQAANLPASEPPGIIQQAALWNINYLATNNLNFGPIYITSGEDVGFGNYFDEQPIPYFYYKGIGVRKEVTGSDNGVGAQSVNKERQACAKWFADAESDVPVRAKAEGDGGEQTLGTFIVNRVLPNASMTIRAQAGDPGTQNTAKCQAVEQITSGAIYDAEAEVSFVTSQALTATFVTNPAQVIRRVNLL